MLSHGHVPEQWKSVFLSVAVIVIMYNAFHFRRVDEQMKGLYRDLTSNVHFEGKSFRTFRFDYPPPRNAWDIAAASIDPLFGAASYAAIDSGGAGTWIFGTSLLRYNKGHESFYSSYKDVNTVDLAGDLFRDTIDSLSYDVVVLVGRNPIIDELMKDYQAQKVLAPLWTILEPRQQHNPTR